MSVQNCKSKCNRISYSILFLYLFIWDIRKKKKKKQMDIIGRLWNAYWGSSQACTAHRQTHSGNDWRYGVMISQLSHWIHFVVKTFMVMCLRVRALVHSYLAQTEIIFEVIKLQSFLLHFKIVYQMEIANKQRIIDQIQGSNNWFNISFGNLLGTQICKLMFRLVCVYVWR